LLETIQRVLFLSPPSGGDVISGNITQTE